MDWEGTTEFIFIIFTDMIGQKPSSHFQRRKEAEDHSDEKPLAWRSAPRSESQLLSSEIRGKPIDTLLSASTGFLVNGEKEYKKNRIYLFCKAAVRFRNVRPPGSPEGMGAAEVITICLIGPRGSKNGESNDWTKKLTSF